MLARRIGVYDQRHVVDVDTAGGDVGRHEGAHAALGESRQTPGPRVLAEVAVQLACGHSGGDELAGQRPGAAFGPGEHQRATWRCREIDQDGQPVVPAHVQQVVRYCGHR